MNRINLSDLNLKILEAHCGMIMPKLGDTELRNQLQRLETEISDIYPPSGDAMKYWRFLNLNPDRVFSLAGTYNEIQLKENIILPGRSDIDALFSGQMFRISDFLQK